jgi:hypothetical protein
MTMAPRQPGSAAGTGFAFSVPSRHRFRRPWRGRAFDTFQEDDQMAIPPTHGRSPNQRRLKGEEDQVHRRGRIDLNQASKEDIMSAAGLDLRTAKQILKFRDEHGGFETWRDFDEIPISEADRDKLRPHVLL